MFESLTLLYWHWFALAAILGVVEILAPGIFFLWLSLAAVASGVVALLVPELSAAGQIIIYSGFAVVSVLIGWKIIKNHPLSIADPTLNQRSAQYVGKLYTLETAIINGSGRVTIGDSSWKVEGTDAPKGSQVRVIGYDGVILKVEKIADPRPETQQSPSTVSHTDSRVDPLQDSLKNPQDNS